MLVKGMCIGEEDVGGGLWDVDGELGELGVERNKTLIGVEIGLGWTVSGLKSARLSCFC